MVSVVYIPISQFIPLNTGYFFSFSVTHVIRYQVLLVDFSVGFNVYEIFGFHFIIIRLQVILMKVLIKV